MVTLIHGEDIVKSRNYLESIVIAFRTRSGTITYLDGSNAHLTELIQATESDSLFGHEQLVVLENLHSSRKKTSVQDIVEYLQTLSIQRPIIIWEAKTLTATQINKIKPSKVELFKPSAVIFKYLESLGVSSSKSMTDLYSQAIHQDSVSQVFYMTANHVRSLIQAVENTLKGPDWKRRKLVQQAHAIGIKPIRKLHQELLMLDQRYKTGQLSHTLDFELELVLLQTLSKSS